MDNFAYLNQISQTSRPVGKNPHKTTNATTRLIIKISIIGVVLFFLLMSLGGLISNLNSKTSDLTKQLYLRTTNLNTAIGSYNRYLKSSKLRAITVSLSSVLSSTSNQLSGYISGTSNKKDISPSESVVNEEAELISGFSTALENARLNGVLDRIYHTQLSLQVSLLMSLTSQIISRTKDDTLTNIVTTFYNNLSTINDQLEAYSSN